MNYLSNRKTEVLTYFTHKKQCIVRMWVGAPSQISIKVISRNKILITRIRGQTQRTIGKV